jgi:hypothetical protein
MKNIFNAAPTVTSVLVNEEATLKAGVDVREGINTNVILK